MAPRKKAKLSNDDEADAPHEDTVSKTPKITRRSRKGYLESVQTLPLDVSLQMFGLLHPKDLLNLAKTSTAFRSFFLNRANSISIWKASLRQVEGLPDKPEFLSEPAFAHLLFNPFCQNCGKSGIPKPIWAWFVRYCSSCIETTSFQLRYWHHSDWPLTQLVRNEGKEIFNVYRVPGRSGAYRIHTAQLEHFVEEWRNTKGDEEQRKVLVGNARTAAVERTVIILRFEAWHAAEKEQRSAELVDMREQRLKGVMDRLNADGWLPEIQYYENGRIEDRLASIPAIRQPSLLTDRGWLKVRGVVRGVMDGLRAVRLHEEREKQVKGRWHALTESILDHYVQLPKTPSMDCRPSLQILLGEKECFDLVVAPKDREVTRRDFAEVLPEVCSRWEASCAEQLRDLVRAAMPTISGDIDPLDLAVAVFKCANSLCSANAAHRYPELLAHTCSCTNSRANVEREAVLNMSRMMVWLSRADSATRYASVPPRTKIHLRSGRPLDSVIRMQYIVSALGLDPTRATREDLEKSEARLSCRVCSPADRKVYTWEGALWHIHLGAGVDRYFWERVREEDMARVRELEAEEGKMPVDKVRWGCTLCRDWDSIGPEVGLHMEEKHQLEDLEKCVEDGTVYRHFNQPYSSTPASVVLPKPKGP
ncbi:hypothetical protein LXA43DRAFT_515466 [Ganoderma leucocontextum]|nr:hypothetical protein LXA43DRAFT_515466 [Ganoderma leucocontextum]